MEGALKELISRSINLHVHVGPEAIPRKFTVADLAVAERGKLAGAVLKNHFYPTVFASRAVESDGFHLIPGLVLNNFVGGLNPDAVYATSLLAGGPFVVWLPTVHAKQFLEESTYEIAPEWVDDKSLTLRRAQDIEAVVVAVDGKLTPAACAVIKAVAAAGAVLATGHISWQEAELVAAYAEQAGVWAVIITHPIYQHIRMPVLVQKRLAAQGCFMEQCYSMYKLDGIAVADIVAEIKAVGAESVVLSSDVGQVFSVPPDEALLDFSLLLLSEGTTLQELEMMLVDNPRRALGMTEKTSYNKQRKREE